MPDVQERIVSPRGRKAAAAYKSFPNGMCSWCGGFIVEPDGRVNRRRKWHKEGRDLRDCLGEYLGQEQNFFRQRVFERDGGVCAECPAGTPPCDTFQNTTGWHADHILALADGGTWDLANAQTLCAPHHKAKTAREATARAQARAELSPQLRIPA